jgi:cytochrome c-type biogenesis protein CcmF
MFLTVGIAMGSYWAYYELGWGGFWFWDPVENASLMPWLVATALLHSAIVMEKRDALKIWTVLLAILAFSLSLIGTFLVRSGVLTSVHAFASDPTRGIFILIILCVFIGGALTLFAFRAGSLAPGGVFAPISREGALVLNNLFLSACAAAVIVGTLYPLALEALTGERISVGAPFYNLTFIPLVVPLLILVPFGPFLAWKRGDLYAVAQRLTIALGVAIAGTIIVAAYAGAHQVLSLFGVWLGIWLIAGAASELAFRVKLGTAPLAESLRRARGLPRSAYGTTLAHIGVGVTVLGIVVATTWSTEAIRSMKPGDTVAIGGYSVTLDGFLERPGANFQETVVRFSVRSGGALVAVMEPSKRQFDVRQTSTTEAAIRTSGFSQLYLSLGDIAADGTTTVRVFWKPLVTWIWLGAIVMAFGGLLSLSDRRLRVGAPRPARRRPQPAPAE